MTCPCKTKLTDEQKDMHNNVGGNVINTSVSTKAGDLLGGLANSSGSLKALQQRLSSFAILGSDNYALQAAGINTNTLGALIGKVDALRNSTTTLKAQADRLSDPQTLMSVVGSMNFYANIGCALGIPGLDVSVSIGAITGNGMNSINVAGNVKLDLDRMMQSVENSITNKDWQAAKDAFNNGVGAINTGMDAVNNTMNSITKASTDMISAAASKITEYTTANFFSTLMGTANDPCNSMGVAINGSVLSDTFKQYADAANKSVSLGGATSR